MAAPELLHHLRGAGLVLTLIPAGGLHVAPRSALTDVHRAAIRAERDALVLTLQDEALRPASRARAFCSSEPDRWAWPASAAMTGAEIDTFTARVALFSHKGLSVDAGEAVADKLVVRDREQDDRRQCLECLHLHQGSGWRCGNWRRAGIAVRARDAQLPTDFVNLLQRCDGFTDAVHVQHLGGNYGQT